MRLRLFKKYFFTTAIIIFFSLTAMTVILSFALNNYLAKNKYNSLQKCCDEIVNLAGELSNEEIQSENFHKTLSALSTVSGVDILISDANGELLICSCEEWLTAECCYHADHLIERENLLTAGDSATFRLGTLSIYQTPHYIAETPVVNNESALVGTVFVTAPLSAIRELLPPIARLYLLSATIPLILMFFAIYAMTYRLTKPLKLMSEASKAMAKGDFSRRIPVTSDDEIGELAVSFNQMTNSLAQLESMRKSFVANVSHELKTPMTTIGGFIDGILDGTIEPDKQNEYLMIVSDEVKRLSRLVQSMLNMAKLESGEFVLRPEWFDFRELLCTIVISQEQRIEEKKLNITGLDEIESISLRADRDLIHQVIYNLVDNAIKFTDPSGNIDFKAVIDGKKLVFTIRNTGRGIPEKELPYVFERFYKVDKSRSANKNSTGLGLYLVKTIVKAHGGTVAVTSKVDSFAAFTVTLPLGN